MAKIVVTGAAGFIGFHIAKRLLGENHQVLGIDNLNSYYDVQLKRDRLALLTPHSNFSFEQFDISDREQIERVFRTFEPEYVVHMAAQAGVRYSLQNPYAYVQSNIIGFFNILEASKELGVKHLVYASSSSVYGANRKIPFSVSDNVDHPVSFYAATKKSNELFAHTYSHLYKLPTTGLRFFTVYGPWGRPDMAIFIFTEAILAGKPIRVFNYGKMRRDFTFIDDIVEGVYRVLWKIPQPDDNWDPTNPDPASSSAPYRVYNIGNNRPVELLHLIELIEKYLGKKAEKKMEPLQPGDVVETYADIDALQRAVGFSPSTPIEEGLQKFIQWYADYKKISLPSSK